MELAFNGTAIYIYGSKRANHGAYSGMPPRSFTALMFVAYFSVTLDDAQPFSGLGRGSPPGLYQQLLYSAIALSSDREHRVRVTNLPSQTSRPSELFFMTAVTEYIPTELQWRMLVLYGSILITP